jgi:5'-AMP-activated protein kinase catalytic alpha subunit
MSVPPEKTGSSTKTYLILKNLGEGSFGKVKEALHVLTQEKIAVKVLEKSRITTEEEKIRVKREIDILRRVRHPNVVQLYEVIETEKYHFLVMEHMEKGELSDYIEERGKVASNY